MADENKRMRLIEVITAPLGFFVLALLIVETFLGTTLIANKNLDASAPEVCVFAGVGMFVLVVGIVALLVWMKPDNLTFDKDAHLSRTVGKVSEELKRDRQIQEILREAMFFRTQKRFVEALTSYERALLYDPNLDEANIGIAVVKSYMDPINTLEPLRILDQVIERAPNSEKAFYNRACIRCLADSTYPKSIWLGDLRRAIQLRNQYRVCAPRDDDFKKYWNDADFLEVIK